MQPSISSVFLRRLSRGAPVHICNTHCNAQRSRGDAQRSSAMCIGTLPAHVGSLTAMSCGVNGKRMHPHALSQRRQWEAAQKPLRILLYTSVIHISRNRVIYSHLYDTSGTPHPSQCGAAAEPAFEPTCPIRILVYTSVIHIAIYTCMSDAPGGTSCVTMCQLPSPP